MKTENIFFTGATGFIGRNLVRRILLKNTYSQLFLLIRSNQQESADVRFYNYVRMMSAETGLPRPHLLDRLILVKGDLESDNFGMSVKLYRKLALKMDSIFHVAASVKLHDSMFRLRRINLGGSTEILRFARLIQEKKGLSGLHYLSTAYVAGKRKGLIYEDELDVGQSFLCNYEQVKYEAEQMFRNAMDELPITVYRPSMVVGDSNTGATCAFNVIYEPLRMLLAGKLPVWSADCNTKLDVVPVDFVCDAMMRIMATPPKAQGKTFHLTIGPDREMVSANLLHTFLAYLETYHELQLAKPRVIAPKVMRIIGQLLKRFGSQKWSHIGKQWMTYADYTGYSKSFDNRNTREVLRPAAIRPPRLEEYFPVIFDFAMQHHFKMPKPVYNYPAEYLRAS